MKKLDTYVSKPVTPMPIHKKAEAQKKEAKEIMMAMPITVPREEAIERKLDKLRVKILGRQVAKFQIGQVRDVWVPYSLMTYSFLIDRKTIFNKDGRLDRKGELNFVYDYNEAHPFQYDIQDNGPLTLKKIDRAEAGAVILPRSVPDQEVREQMEWHIQNKVLRRVYSTHGKIALVNEKKFYRAAVEMEVIYGENKHVRYAYLDDYGVDSEHILGLKYRMG